MNYTVAEVTGRADWERLILTSEHAPFLQSWMNGELNRELGSTVYRLGLFEAERLIGGALLIKIAARRGHFLFCPYGPILNWENSQQVMVLFKAIKQLAEKQNLTFIRVSPLLELNQIHQNIFSGIGYRKAPIHMLAEHLWLLDVNKNEDELLADMRKNTRNLIRRAERDGVSIEQRTDEEAIDIFIRLHHDTVDRQQFTPYPDSYFREQVKAFAPDNQVQVFLAKHQGEYVSAAIIMFYGQAGAYHHGASKPGIKVPASYLLQWESIKETKRRGLATYNFWGIVPEDKAKGHPWAGLSLFKRGFGGYQFDLVPCHDLELKPRYYANYLLERYRKWKRKV